MELDIGEHGAIIGVLKEWHHQVPHVLAEGAQVLLKGLLHLLQKMNLRFGTCCAQVIVIGVALDPSNVYFEQLDTTKDARRHTESGSQGVTPSLLPSASGSADLRTDL